MTNPHPTDATAIDIAASAERVTALIRQGRVHDGLSLLERLREGERPIVQEALDRYVTQSALTHVRSSAMGGNLDAAHRPVLERLQQAGGPPRMPEYSHLPGEPNELAGLTDAQKYDIYASAVATRGNETARNDLQRNGHSVLLGLRRETSVLASPGGGRLGTGVYDDQMVVLSRTAEGEKRVFIAARSSTEPTAQYSHHAGSDGNRPISGQREPERRRLAPAPGYEAVRWRAIQGEDANGDTMHDLGRLAEGTIEMQVARHLNPRSAGTPDAFRPSPEQLAQDRIGRMVQRDTNADGRFDHADQNGFQDLNVTFKIHSGSRSNTDSAGCQTIHPEDYLGFIQAATGNPQQTRWQYVLTSTHDGAVREAVVGERAAAGGAGVGAAGEQRGNPQGPLPAIPAPHRHRPQSGEPERTRPPGDRQGHVPASPGPFSDEGLNRYYAAVLGGDAALADRIALGFAPRLSESGLQRPGEPVAKTDEGLERHREETARAHVPGLQV